jgi:hypothetical protein
MGDGDFIDVMKDAISAIAPGLENFGQQVGAELDRLGTQGAAELASALFSDGNSYVAYGRGQYAPSPEADMGSPVPEAPTVEPPVQEAQAVAPPVQEYGGMEM